MAMSVMASMIERVVNLFLERPYRFGCWLFQMPSRLQLTIENDLDDDRQWRAVQSCSISPFLPEFSRGNCSDPADNTEFSVIYEESCCRRYTESAR